MSAVLAMLSRIVAAPSRWLLSLAERLAALAELGRRRRWWA